MKRNKPFMTGAAGLLLLSMLLLPEMEVSAQEKTWKRHDTQAELNADLTKAGGEYDLYDFDLPEMTKAPKGYEPVYISHFGRHGSRYALGDKVYEELLEILRKGLKNGKLTEKGKNLLYRYEEIYPELAYRGGELTQKGQTQHRLIAHRMFEDFPEVFEGETVAHAITTNSHRVIMSMAAFTNELTSMDPDFSLTMDEGLIHMAALHPNSSHNPYKIPAHPRSAEAKAAVNAFQQKKLDLAGFGSRFFSDVDFLDKEYGLYKFMMDVRTIIVDFPSLDHVPSDLLQDMITKEELIHFWEVWNFNGYLTMGRSPLSDQKNCMCFGPVLRNILEEAEQDLKDGKTQLRLRFTHDVALLPLLSFMGVNSFGAVIEDPEEVADYWRCYDVPMASNLQLVFFRNKKIAKKNLRLPVEERRPEILVKILLNGREATIPIDEYCPSFYSWESMKAYYGPMMDQADDFIVNY